MFKIHLLQEESIRQLYQNRLNLYLTKSSINNNINQEWTEIKEIIIRAATEALGTRKKNYKRRGLKIWNEDMANLTKMKKDAYRKYLNQKTNDNLIDYKHKCAIVRREVRKIKRNSWDKYINDIEYDIHGRQDKAYKILTHLCKKERDNLQLNLIPEETWLQYYQDLWTEKEETEEEILTQIDENVDPITFDELLLALNNFKNKNPQEQIISIGNVGGVGADCLGPSNISRWCRFFEEGHRRPGRTVTAATPPNVRGNQTPYSPDFALSNFHVFRPMKNFPGDQRFSSDEQVKSVFHSMSRKHLGCDGLHATILTQQRPFVSSDTLPEFTINSAKTTDPVREMCATTSTTSTGHQSSHRKSYFTLESTVLPSRFVYGGRVAILAVVLFKVLPYFNVARSYLASRQRFAPLCCDKDEPSKRCEGSTSLALEQVQATPPSKNMTTCSVYECTTSQLPKFCHALPRVIPGSCRYSRPGAASAGTRALAGQAGQAKPQRSAVISQQLTSSLQVAELTAAPNVSQNSALQLVFESTTNPCQCS
ncbi:hypothetical protein ANN_16936 [Periplaneta americana]|uniref:Uncharacterized protein n=1 Tax=Periplaneta americana TaxID=6978 RepID=A0ABQ8SSL4_PERAM|nr:hypothetical protein ANN_16936 [Periplaneta americana]